MATKISARTRKLQDVTTGTKILKARRKGLGKILTVLSRGTSVVVNPYAVELLAMKHAL